MSVALKHYTKESNFKTVDFDPFAGPKLIKAIPTTEPQLEIWLSCVIGGEDANKAYNESVSLILEGPLERETLIDSLHEVINRHELLRSTMSPDGKSICVYESLPLSLDYQDFSALSEAERKEQLTKIHHATANIVFDLERGPLFKVALVKLSTTTYFLKLSAHHIICDGWSFGIILENLSAIYSSRKRNDQLNLGPVVSFGQYAVELSTYMKSDDYLDIERYWLNQYANEVPVLDLPTDHQRPPVRTFNSQRLDFPVSKSFIDEVRKVGAKSGASLVSTLIVSFESYLHLLTGQKDIVLGIPAAGQSATGQHELVGHCVSMLPLRSRIASATPFNEHLRLRKSQILDDYDHQNFTFGSLLKKLPIARDSSRIPLVPVVLNLDMGMDANVSFADLDHSLSSDPRSFENFEIFLNITGTKENLVFEWSYNTLLFKEETITRMMNDFKSLLEQIVAHPGIEIREIVVSSNKIIDPTNDKLKRIELLNNSTKTNYPKDKIVTEFITTSAERYPSKTAVYFQDAELSYHELEKTSNQLAHFLIQKGVKKGDIVGLMVDRSFNMIISLLAIIKSGAAYLPLDPHYPEGRLTYMLEDSGTTHLIISEAHSPFSTRCISTVIEQVYPSLNNYSSDKPVLNMAGSDLAYILYTSGSTGRPKGVQIEHHSLTNFLLSVEKQPGMTVSDTILAIATISFDIAGTELLLPLFTGASINLVDFNSAKDGRELLKLVEKKNITIMQATPTTWRMMIAAGWEKKLPLKIICTGEAFPKDLAKDLQTRGTEVWNGYGPTETTIWSTLKQLSEIDEQITIGRPLNNTKIFILDESLKPVKHGTTGEICIAGEGLARGYLNLPSLTSEKFVTFTFNGNIENVYKTGDLGYQLNNGDFVCLGRSDEQVKIRGQRIELSEIEFALSRQDDIKEAVVTVQQKSDDQRLVAYIVPSEGKLAEWHHLWDEIYTQGIEKEKNIAIEDQDLDIAIVTNDEVDGVIHGAEWKSESLKRLKALESNSILELGSGGGHIMFGLAPSVSKYVATDYSEVAINKLNEKLSLDRDKWGHVEAFPASADDFSKIDPGFDLVLLHSVIQYFPNLRYLFDVIQKSIDVLNDGGCIFIGDSQTDESAYMHIASEQLKYVNEKATISDFKKIIDFRIQQQNELSVDPGFFYFLPTLIPSITAVDIQIRSGDHLNETTKSHYDVWLYKGSNAPRILESEIIREWEEINTIENLSNILQTNRDRVIQINRINNQRIDHDLAIVNGIRTLSDDMHVDYLKTHISRNHRASSINPTDLWKLGQEHGYNAHVRWANDGADGQIEVVFLPSNKNAFIPNQPSQIRFKSEDEYFSQEVSKVEVLEISQQQVESWKSSLKSLLPEHMIPSIFIGLTQLPITRNGKIDRKSLPATTVKNPEDDNNNFVAPRTEEEIAIAEIWTEYLGIPIVSANSNFFELGGHSLTAVRVMLAIEKRFGIKLPISILFENSTIEKLSRLITGEQKGSKWQSLVPIKTSGSKVPVYLVHGGGFNVLTFEPFSKHMDPEQPIYALQGLGLIDGTKPVSSIEEIASYYISEVLENDPVGPYALGGYCSGGIIAYEMARQLRERGKEVSMLALLDSENFNYSKGASIVRYFKKALFYSTNIWKKPKLSFRYFKSKAYKSFPILERKDEISNYEANVNEAYHNAFMAYKVKPMNIRVLLFKARDRGYYLDDPYTYGWRKFALEGIETYTLNGNHNTFITHPHEKEFAVTFQRIINQAHRYVE